MPDKFLKKALFLPAVFSSLLFMAVCANNAAAGGADSGNSNKAASVSRSDSGRPMFLPVAEAPLIFRTDKGEQKFSVEIARSDAEKSRGLMYRRLLPQDRAMLFIFAQERSVSMWMENTPLPLDMIFADKQGKIVYIHEKAKPYSRNFISSPRPVAYVVELNGGQAAARGIKPGQIISGPAIAAAP